MNPPKSEQELELLVKAEHAYANRTEEFCNDYKSWMAGARSVIRAHQSETELLRKRVENLRGALWDLANDSFDALICSGYGCVTHAQNALKADDKASEGGV